MFCAIERLFFTYFYYRKLNQIIQIRTLKYCSLAKLKKYNIFKS
jgi:hypothetical protein